MSMKNKNTIKADHFRAVVRYKDACGITLAEAIVDWNCLLTAIQRKAWLGKA